MTLENFSRKPGVEFKFQMQRLVAENRFADVTEDAGVVPIEHGQFPGPYPGQEFIQSIEVSLVPIQALQDHGQNIADPKRKCKLRSASK